MTAKLELKTASGGKVILDPTDTAVDRTLTLPATGATLLTDSAGILNIGSGQVYKDASGNVMIGGTTPGHRLEVVKSDPSSLGAIARFYHGPASNRSIEFGTSSISPFPLYIQGRASGSATNDMTLQPEGGNLLVGLSTLINSNRRLQVLGASGGAASAFQVGNNGEAGCEFYNAAGAPVGSVTVNVSSTSYNTSSDYRLKENVQPMTGALEKVAALNPVTYTWKSDGSAGQGFIAHELQEVCPDCVTGEKDEVRTADVYDDEGRVIGTKEEPQYQGVDTSFLVGILTKAIQELNAKVDAQAAEIAALKGGTL